MWRLPELLLKFDFRFAGEGYDKPWCYTTDPNMVWDYCDVQLCPVETTDSPPETTPGYNLSPNIIN